MKVTYTLKVTMEVLETQDTNLRELKDLMLANSSVELAKALGTVENARVDIMLDGGRGISGERTRAELRAEEESKESV